MAFYSEIKNREQRFIESQKMFFVATAPKNGRINLSPKGMDTFRVVDKHRVIWLNLTGSGNETAAHLLNDGRITIMFCAFEGAPMIVRLYGKARAIHPKDKGWSSLVKPFPKLIGSRQIIDISIDSVQTSCGMSVPFYEYKSERNQLNKWAENKGEAEIEAYLKERNELSIDGIPTGI